MVGRPTFLLHWWRIFPSLLMGADGTKGRMMQKLHHEGWVGLAVHSPSIMERRIIDGWFDALPPGESIRVQPRKLKVYHPVSGSALRLSQEFFIRSEGSARTLEAMLEAVPPRIHEIAVGPSAPPAVRSALEDLNWMVTRGTEGRLLTVQDVPPDRLIALRTLAALTKHV